MKPIVACARACLLGLALLGLAGCAVTPDARPQYARKFADAPAQPFRSVVLVVMPVTAPPPPMAAAYEKHWRSPQSWREPFFRRLERNFEHNGIALKVFDASRSGSIQITPAMLDLRLSVQNFSLRENWLSFGIRVEASNRGTRYMALEDQLTVGGSPESAADRQTYLLLNALRDAGLIPPPPAGGDYTLAP